MTVDTTTPAYKSAEAYERFVVSSIFRYWTPLLLERAAPAPGERVLDVACGTGVVARSIVPLVGPAPQVVALDINPAMLAVACRQFSDYCAEIDWREGRAEELPFQDDEFDLVTCQQGLQFFTDRAVAAAEMHRVLRPEGRLAVEVWQPLDRNPFYEAYQGALASEFEIDIGSVAAPYAFGDPDELRYLLLDAGFRQVRVESLRQPVCFEDLDAFVRLSIKSAATVVPNFVEPDDDELAALQARLARRVADLFDAHMVDGKLTFPMFANIATAVC